MVIDGDKIKMAKRVFEVAKEFGVKAPQIVELLANHNIFKTNFGKVDDKELSIIKEELKNNSQESTANNENVRVYAIDKPELQALGSAKQTVLTEDVWNSETPETNGVNDTSQHIDWNEYDEAVIKNTPIEEVAVNFVKKQAKLEILETNDWWLPIPIYSIKYQLTKFRPINLIEEYILRCINEKELKLGNVDEMVEFLKIDEVFIKHCLQEMIENALIVKRENEEYNLTEEGKTTLETGKEQVAIKSANLIFAYKPSLGIQIYDESLLLQANETLPENEKLCNYNLPIEENDNIRLENIDNNFIQTIAEKQGKEFSAAGKGSTVLKVVSVEKITDKFFHLGEVWLYDAINFEVTGKIWDFLQGRWLVGVEKYIPEEKKEQLYNDYKKRINEEKQKSLKTLWNRQLSNENNKIIETLRGSEIRKEFLKCFDEVNKEIIIVSPWINDHVVDAAMLKRFQNIVNRGAAVYIGWGIARNIEDQDKKPSNELMKQIKAIANEEGYPGIYIYYIGNHHDKEVLVDERYHMLGSFNWLSYRGEYNIRHESVNKIYDKGHVLAQRKILEKVFYEVLERELNDKSCFADINSIYRWFGAVIHLQEEKKARTELVLKAINDLASINSEALINVFSMYNKNKIKDFGYELLKQKRDEFVEKKKEEAKKNMIPRKELVELLNCSNFDLLKVTKMIGIKNISAFSKEDAEKIIEAFEKLRK